MKYKLAKLGLKALTCWAVFIPVHIIAWAFLMIAMPISIFLRMLKQAWFFYKYEVFDYLKMVVGIFTPNGWVINHNNVIRNYERYCRWLEAQDNKQEGE